MLLTTHQAASKLGCTPPTIIRACRKGILTDRGVTRPGSVRHSILVDDKEVLALAKTHIYTGQRWVERGAPTPVKIAATNGHHTNGHALPESAATLAPTAGLISRLAAIEAKLDALLKVWS